MGMAGGRGRGGGGHATALRAASIRHTHTLNDRVASRRLIRSHRTTPLTRSSPLRQTRAGAGLRRTRQRQSSRRRPFEGEASGVRRSGAGRSDLDAVRAAAAARDRWQWRTRCRTTRARTTRERTSASAHTLVMATNFFWGILTSYCEPPGSGTKASYAVVSAKKESIAQACWPGPPPLAMCAARIDEPFERRSAHASTTGMPWRMKERGQRIQEARRGMWSRRSLVSMSAPRACRVAATGASSMGQRYGGRHASLPPPTHAPLRPPPPHPHPNARAHAGAPGLWLIIQRYDVSRACAPTKDAPCSARMPLGGSAAAAAK